MIVFFFFQAEDGIRDLYVTGVQTCALPISDGSAASRHLAAIEKACALLRTSETMPSLAELADAAAISRFHFHRVFKQITGVTPREYARSHRLGRLGDKLDAGQPIAASIYATGFGSSSRAYEAAPAGVGMTPGARRRR